MRQPLPGATIQEGDLTTDAKGEAHLTFPTQPKGKILRPEQIGDQRYTIVADVVDDSRRQVTGVGMAQAAVTQFRAFLKPDRRWTTPGDPLNIEIKTRDAQDRPVSAGGYLTFVRVIPAVPQEYYLDPITGMPLLDPKTHKPRIKIAYQPSQFIPSGKWFVPTEAAKDGTTTFAWRPDTPGDYQMRYEARDDRGNRITASANTLVYGRDFDARLKKYDRRFELRPERGDVPPGETARLLLIAPKPDSYVLLTEQNAGQIVRQRALFVPGRSTLIELPITAQSVPNLDFSATLIRDGQVSEIGASVGVPAENKILALTVTPDKPTYKPGERAVFTLHATDALGQPAAGVFSLGVVDSSLLAIQPDLTPDIRRAFYGYRIQENIASAPSTSYQPNALIVQPDQQAYETHTLTLPEGLGWFAERSNTVYLPPYAPDIDNSPDTVGESAGGGFGGGATYKDSFGRDLRFSADAFAEFRSGRGRYNFQDYSGALGEAGPAGPPGAMTPASSLASANRAKFGLIAGAKLDTLSLDADNISIVRSPAPSAPLVEAVVRRLFADTATWLPEIHTDAQGNARVEFAFPDNLTQWQVTTRGLTPDVKVGIAQAQAVTRKNLLVRLQAPRFFVERDQVTLSANVHNYLETAKNARIELVVDGEHLAAPAAPVVTRSVGKDGEVRIDWTVAVSKAGPTKIKVVAQTDQESDAAELEFPVLTHGVEKFIVRNGVLVNGGQAAFAFDLPEMRRKGATLLDVQCQPSLGAVLLDALPYLEDYPYGCIEQTTSRFVPTVLVAKTLRDAGLDLETLGRRAQALAEQRKAIPPQTQYADSGYTYPKGAPGVLSVSDLASRLPGSYHNRSGAPIFDSKTLQSMTEAGLERIETMQRDDGSWGWWQGSGVGDPYLTAYVTEYLTLAEQAGIVVKPTLLAKARAYLHDHLNSTDDLDLTAYYDYVLSLQARTAKLEKDALWGDTDRKLYERRDRLTPYGQALLALAFGCFSDRERGGVLVRNLVTLAKFEPSGVNVHWEGDDKYWWRWQNDKQETTATVLRALLAFPNANVPGRDLPALAVRWLVDNRRAGIWTSTKQTAIVINALLEYVRARQELTPDYTVTLDVDGRVTKTVHITKENALLFDERFLVGDEILQSGGQTLHVTMTGTGSLYWSAYLKYFDQQEPITGQANAIAVTRRYYKIVPPAPDGKKKRHVAPEPQDTAEGDTAEADGKETVDDSTSANGKGRNKTPPVDPTRIPLKDGAMLASGDIIEVELLLKSDNDYDHLVFEDMKPAGCEAVETRSGTAYGDGLCSNFELRDEKVAFFVDTLPQGTRRITYRLRAEIPGAFHALPTNAYAMYAPDIRALSDEWRVTITDAPVKK